MSPFTDYSYFGDLKDLSDTNEVYHKYRHASRANFSPSR